MIFFRAPHSIKEKLSPRFTRMHPLNARRNTDPPVPANDDLIKENPAYCSVFHQSASHQH